MHSRFDDGCSSPTERERESADADASVALSPGNETNADRQIPIAHLPTAHLPTGTFTDWAFTDRGHLPTWTFTDRVQFLIFLHKLT